MPRKHDSRCPPARCACLRGEAPVAMVIATPFHAGDRMRSLLVRSATLLALLASILPAQARTSAPTRTAVELTRLEDQWAAGLVRRDRALFERLLAPRFVYTENDKLMRRGEVLHEVAEGTDTTTAAHNEGMEVHQFGPTTAVVTGWLVVQGRGKGGPFLHRYRFTDTWVKGPPGWRIVAAQDFLAP